MTGNYYPEKNPARGLLISTNSAVMALSYTGISKGDKFVCIEQ